ncbi:P-loop containing nucleoside triphosphate hydrolase protein [Clavulina sp. PMI_390]|nr:P-loop containing nucleoside triphosphate hydrolase protein [Clavulina sp. PMI_390]
MAQTFLAAYLLFLSYGIARSIRRLSSSLAQHRAIILLVEFLVLAYRDIWPLATYNQTPVDAPLGLLGWSRVALVFWAGIVVPLIIPGVYVPVDPKHPLPPNEEQLSSLLSIWLFGFVDPLIRKAFRHAHLPFDELPLLADDDHSKYLRDKSIHLLDPMTRKSKRHIGWSLIRFYGKFLQFKPLGSIAILDCLLEFVSPLAIFNLLQYVETKGAGSTIKPWFWVIALFLRSIVASIVNHRYLYLVTKLRVQLEALITQVVFEHALRIRVKEDNKSSDAAPAPTPVVAETSLPTTDATAGDPPEVVPSTGTLENPVAADIVAEAVVATTSSESPPQTETTTPPDSGKVDKKSKGEETKSANLFGKINNLITSDLSNIVDLPEIPMAFVYTPLKIGLSVWFLYKLLGWSFFVGFILMVIGLVVPGRPQRPSTSIFSDRSLEGWVTGLMHQTIAERSKRTDARVEAINETVGLARLIKMFGWESQMEKKLDKLREEELKYVKQAFIYQLFIGQFSWVFPFLTLIVTYFTFSVIMKQPLTASVVFTSLSVLDSLRGAISQVMWQLPMMIRGKVSLDRVDAYLRDTELLDVYTSGASPSPFPPSEPGDAIAQTSMGFRNAHFTWTASSPAESGASTPYSPGSRRKFILRIDGNVSFIPAGLNLIVGPTGAGKTSVLLALLGEMHFIQNEVDSWYHLPRDGGVAFCPQEAWILNETIRDNIVFGDTFDEQRYKQVLNECALEQDLSIFEAGDKTEVGERGLTLSGGQKARISLARAVYSKAKVILLDDILAALDVHTAKWIVDKCLRGKLLRGRTVVLVTHSVSLVGHLARQIIGVSVNGEVTVQETKDVEVVDIDDNIPVDDDIPVENKDASGKLIADEEVVLGSMSYSALRMFLKSTGGSVFWMVYLGAISIVEFFDMFQIWWLGRWSAQYDTHAPGEVDVLYYLGVFCLAILSVTIVHTSGQIVWVTGNMRASRSIHSSLLKSILKTTLRFLDRTPVGRILQRFTQDIRTIDQPFPTRLNNVFQLTILLIEKMAAIVIFTPVFIFPGVGLGVIGGIIAQVYIKSQLPVKREMSLARTPVLSHFGTSIQGLSSIRAYDAQERFINESLRRIDRYSRVARPFWNLNRWVGLRIDVLGGFFIALLAAYLVLVSRPNAATIGFLLNLSFSLTELFFIWIRILNSAQVDGMLFPGVMNFPAPTDKGFSGNSVERIEQYLEIEQEPAPTVAGQPPASWPTSGTLVVEKLEARYSPDGPKVLRNISFECNSGEKVGIVGRTGSGKSSLTLALLRLIPTDGEVYYDGLSTKALNLDALRLNVTIIPQQPELMSGSIRQNLDPFEEHDDAELNDALRAAGLFALQEDVPAEDRIGLDTSVSGAGGNFSLGQRQIIALARALVRRSKILILDEATASMDHKTDALIQNSLRTQFNDCTVLTIAHRLQTIMDSDKILVLDSGNLAEFDSPQNLLVQEGSIFKAMVDGSDDRERLLALANIPVTEA